MVLRCGLAVVVWYPYAAEALVPQPAYGFHTHFFFVPILSNSFKTEFMSENHIPLLTLMPFEFHRSFTVRIVN